MFPSEIIMLIGLESVLSGLPVSINVLIPRICVYLGSNALKLRDWGVGLPLHPFNVGLYVK